VHPDTDINYFQEKSYEEIKSLVIRPIQKESSELDNDKFDDSDIDMNISMSGSIKVAPDLRAEISRVFTGDSIR